MDKELEKLYTSVETGLFSSPAKLYMRAKQAGLKITLKQVTNFIKSYEVAQMTRQQRKPKGKQTGLITYHPRDFYQLDILIYDNYAYKGYKYILICIDVYSRYVQALPLKRRTGPALKQGLTTMFQKMGDPANLTADNEFNKKVFEPFLKKHVKGNIFFSDPEDRNKNVYVESFNRTLRLLLQRYRMISGSRDWLTVLPKIIQNYNTLEHSRTKRTPVSLFGKKNKTEEEHPVVARPFKIGEMVRIQTKRKVFAKASESVLSQDVYLIVSFKGKRYRVKNMTTGTEKAISEQRLVRNTGPIKMSVPPKKTGKMGIAKQRKKQQRALKKMGLDDAPAPISRKRRLPKRAKAVTKQATQKGSKKIAARKRPKKTEPQRYEIEKFVGFKKEGSSHYYKVRYMGYNSSYDEWLPRKDLISTKYGMGKANFEEMLQDFKKKV